MNPSSRPRTKIVFFLGVVLLAFAATLIGVGISLHSTTAVEDNPARLKGFDPASGTFTIEFYEDGSLQTRTAPLAGLEFMSSSRMACVLGQLNENHHGYFSARIDHNGSFELFVLDASGENVVFNDLVMKRCPL